MWIIESIFGKAIYPLLHYLFLVFVLGKRIGSLRRSLRAGRIIDSDPVECYIYTRTNKSTRVKDVAQKNTRGPSCSVY